MAEFQIYYVAAAVVFGLLIGSFLNVCIYRVPRDLSVVAPRSFCPECGKPVAWYDNVPVFSYMILRGRCRHCRKAIGVRYPLVELATAALFAAAALRYGWSLAAGKWMLFFALLIVLFCTDFEERILPDELTLGGALVGVVFAIFVPVAGVFGELLFPAWHPVALSLFNAGLGAVLLALPIWLLGLAYERVRGREGLGFGDVKLLGMFGIFLGLEQGLLALVIGAVGGSVIGLLFVVLARRKFSETELPFGAFLCAGAAVAPLIRLSP